MRILIWLYHMNGTLFFHYNAKRDLQKITSFNMNNGILEDNNKWDENE